MKTLKSTNWECSWGRGFEVPIVHIPHNAIRLQRPKPPTAYYHYSNPESQNSLIVETPGYPDFYTPTKEEIHSAYSDRMWSWDAKRMERACKIAGGGDQNWASCLRGATADLLRTFAKECFGLKKKPKHVRVVHHYNVATGYSCPTVEAISDK